MGLFEARIGLISDAGGIGHAMLAAFKAEATVNRRCR